MLPAETHEVYRLHSEDERDEYDEKAVGVALQAEEMHDATDGAAVVVQYAAGEGQVVAVE